MSHMASERNPMGGGQRTLRPRALVWDLFGDHLRYVGDGRIPTRALSALLGVFGVGDSTSRVVLARMPRALVRHLPQRAPVQLRAHRAGACPARRRTITHLRARDQRVGRAVADGHLRRSRAGPVAARPTPQGPRLARFRPLASATWISPHPRLDVIAEALQERSAGRFDLLESRALDRAVDREMARRCWDLDGLAREYAGLLARRVPEASAAHCPGRAARESGFASAS